MATATLDLIYDVFFICGTNPIHRNRIILRPDPNRPTAEQGNVQLQHSLKANINLTNQRKRHRSPCWWPGR